MVNTNIIQLPNRSGLCINVNQTEDRNRISIECHMKRNGFEIQPYILKYKTENAWITFDHSVTIKKAFEEARRRQYGTRVVYLYLEIPPRNTWPSTQYCQKEKVKFETLEYDSIKTEINGK